MNIILSIFKKELIDVLRDRRTLMFMVVIPILITPLLVIGSIKFQEYQNKKSEEKILNIAFINDSEDHLIKKLLLVLSNFPCLHQEQRKTYLYCNISVLY